MCGLWHLIDELFIKIEKWKWNQTIALEQLYILCIWTKMIGSSAGPLFTLKVMWSWEFCCKSGVDFLIFLRPNASSDQFQPKRLLIDLFMSYLLVYSLIKLVHFWGKKFTKTVGSMRKQPVDGAAVVRDAGGLTVACGEPSLGLPWRRRASQVGIV